jgi:hypothetical protein
MLLLKMVADGWWMTGSGGWVEPRSLMSYRTE